MPISPVLLPEGIEVGHAENAVGGSGCTVVLCRAGGAAGVAIHGGAPASHETELLRPENTVQHVHAIVLAGGSAFGLAACS
ncbi:MAG: P1 family peptidase, partial [Zoogloeaceae bacterium]|nr:P1 family peptidase [Zoogloeaceae bacterium]